MPSKEGYFNTLQIMTTLIELKEAALFFKKDTSRKRVIFFKKCIVDLNYVIDHVEPQIAKRGIARHHGEIINVRELRSLKAERDLIINSFEELTK